MRLLVGRRSTEKPRAHAEGPPVTERTLKTLLDDLRRNIAADITLFEEIRGVSGRLHDSEVATAAHEVRIANLEKELSELKCTQAQIQTRMAAAEDRRRWKNIKMRGLPDNIATAKIPHLLSRLFTQLFSAKQSKLVAVDGCFSAASTSNRHQGRAQRCDHSLSKWA
ncbi:Hypothetical predicted protein [Pelobates cultripes]|uniref:Uncharacterized protein n=1 Tax=Pelobates cultripes TaxID=61616 RepID=A0AAD1S3D7_PELCU|nr:Hypothetical predicted protein [Pelobates cultripes]